MINFALYLNKKKSLKIAKKRFDLLMLVWNNYCKLLVILCLLTLYAKMRILEMLYIFCISSLMPVVRFFASNTMWSHVALAMFTVCLTSKCCFSSHLLTRPKSSKINVGHGIYIYCMGYSN